MEHLSTQIQSKFKSLQKNEKVALITIIVILAGSFFFCSGITIGEAFYKINH
jgi:cell division protein FtsL